MDKRDDEAVITPIQIGRVIGPGIPKNANWVWCCACPDCRPLPVAEKVRGPFRTRRDAKRDAEQRISLIISQPVGNA
jgi:hypothetical protein